jgi:hypothetical protein
MSGRRSDGRLRIRSSPRGDSPGIGPTDLLRVLEIAVRHRRPGRVQAIRRLCASLRRRLRLLRVSLGSRSGRGHSRGFRIDRDEGDVVEIECAAQDLKQRCIASSDFAPFGTRNSTCRRVQPSVLVRTYGAAGARRIAEWYSLFTELTLDPPRRRELRPPVDGEDPSPAQRDQPRGQSRRTPSHTGPRGLLWSQSSGAL